jgi:hypothetical protein
MADLLRRWAAGVKAKPLAFGRSTVIRTYGGLREFWANGALKREALSGGAHERT